MRAATAVWGNDLRTIVRDRTVSVFLVVPLSFLLLLRFAYPFIERETPRAGDFASLTLAVFCLIAGAFPALMSSFIMLEEKDQGLFVALRVLPVAPVRLLASRMLGVAVVSFIYPLLLILGSGLTDRQLLLELVLALLCALGSPAAALVVVASADNTIEGLTLFKALFFVYALLAVAVAIPGWWTFLVAVVPTYWVYAAFEADATGDFLAAAGVGLVLHMALIVVSYFRFARGLL